MKYILSFTPTHAIVYIHVPCNISPPGSDGSQFHILKLLMSLSLFSHRDALSLGESEEVALENFRKKLAEAVNNSRFVTFNWFCHNVARAGN